MSRFYPHNLAASDTELPGQFILGGSGISVPVGWTTRTFRSWTLASHPSLPVLPVLSPAGTALGWLLGHVITRDGTFATDSQVLPSHEDEESALENFVGGLSGRFLLVMLEGKVQRIYTDAFAMLAAVHAPSAGAVASTSRLIPVDAATPWDVATILATDIPYGNSMYPLGLTPRRGIERLLPNHYLDLSSWKLVRRWPGASRRAEPEPAAVVEHVAALASRNIAAIAAVHPVQSPLTAGRDSRLLLACSRAVADRMVFFTAQFPGHVTGWRDVRIATRIAEHLRLNHSLLRYRPPRRRDLHEWVQRTAGEAGELTGWHGVRTLKQVSRNRATLLGWAGDIARPIYWKSHAAGVPVTPAQVVDICGVPQLPLFLDRARRWLASIPTDNPVVVLDTLLAEQRGGCWTGVIEYAEDGYSLLRLAPLCNEEIVRQLQSLPEEYRRRMVFERDVIATTWPELLEFPFNEQVPVPPMATRYYRARSAVASTIARVQRITRHARNEPQWLVRKLTRRE